MPLKFCCCYQILTSKNKTRSPGGGRDTLIFSYKRRLGPFFGVQNFEFQYFWGVFRKINIVLGMKILWIFFGVYPKIGLYF